MKKVAIKLDGTKEQFFRAQGYLEFLGAGRPFTQWARHADYMARDTDGSLHLYERFLPDDIELIDPFSVQNHGALKANDRKTFPRDMMCYDHHSETPTKDYVYAIIPDRESSYKVIGSKDVWKNAKEIDCQPTELDQLKAENEMLKDKINRLKNLANNEM